MQYPSPMIVIYTIGLKVRYEQLNNFIQDPIIESRIILEKLTSNE